MARIAVLTGNGLSVALSQEFSIPKITAKFFDRLKPEHRAFVEHHMSDKNNKSDFEECIANIERFYDALQEHQSFFSDSEYGSKFIASNGLDLSELLKHEKSIRESIYLYTALILEVINGNVKRHQIEARLPNFVKWLSSITGDHNEVDLFTLNYDLLLETILLDIVGPNNFMEFYHRAGPWFAVSPDVLRYFFKPEKAEKNKKACKIRLYHLHGSLSSFNDLKNKKIFKIKTETIRQYNIYNRISELNITPSMITGGRKNDKIKEEPFCFYFNKFIQKMSDRELLCDKLFIIGYSFRDEHINSAIMERMNLTTQAGMLHPLELIIVDYAKSDEEKSKFIRDLNLALGLADGASGQFIENDRRILFDGADSIRMTM